MLTTVFLAKAQISSFVKTEKNTEIQQRTLIQLLINFATLFFDFETCIFSK